MMILVLTLISILVAVYALNRVPLIRDLDRLLEIVRLSDPSVVAFTLRRDDATGKYVNVSYNDKGKAISKLESYPVTKLGDYVIPKDHGVVEKLENGFKISGFDLLTFDCPSGYSGPTCQSTPFCAAGVDDGKLKPLTYTQFNELHLSYNDSGVVVARERRDAETHAQATHPRIRINCLSGGRYELQVCPRNKLLDESLRCRAYDVCQDKLSGYKHNDQILDSQAPLERTEYYICENGASTKTRCSDGTVFSAPNNGCVAESVCFGKGESTIARDANSYIKCSNDTGTVVRCEHGAVQNAHGQWLCDIVACEPRLLTYADHTLEYAYGRVECVNNKPRTTRCDTSVTTKRFDYEWAEEFSYNLDHWPSEILNLATGKCESATLDIIKNPVQLAWSRAMREEHPFDLRASRYVCDESAAYRWDYINGTTVPATDLFVDPGAPCRTVASDSPPWTVFRDLARYPIPSKPSAKAPMLVGEPTHFELHGWPTYSESTKTYSVSLLSVTDRAMTVSTYTTSIPPLGFLLKPTDDPKTEPRPLSYLGFGVPPNAHAYRWFTIATGEFAEIRSSEAPISVIRYEMPALIGLAVTEPTKYAILWDRLPRESAHFVTDKNGKKYSISRSGITESEVDAAGGGGGNARAAVPWRTVLFPAHTLLSVSKKHGGGGDTTNIVTVRLSRSFALDIDLRVQSEIRLLPNDRS